MYVCCFTRFVNAQVFFLEFDDVVCLPTVVCFSCGVFVSPIQFYSIHLFSIRCKVRRNPTFPCVVA